MSGRQVDLASIKLSSHGTEEAGKETFVFPAATGSRTRFSSTSAASPFPRSPIPPRSGVQRHYRSSRTPWCDTRARRSALKDKFIGATAIACARTISGPRQVVIRRSWSKAAWCRTGCSTPTASRPFPPCPACPSFGQAPGLSRPRPTGPPAQYSRPADGAVLKAQKRKISLIFRFLKLTFLKNESRGDNVADIQAMQPAERAL